MSISPTLRIRRTIRTMVTAGLAVTTTIGVAACAGNDADTAASPERGEAATDDLAAARARLDGRYAHYDVVAYQGDGMKTLIVSYGFTDLKDKGGELIAQESFCFSEHRSDQPITTEVSDAFTQAIKPVPIATDLTVGSNGRASIHRDETPTALGIDLADPGRG